MHNKTRRFLAFSFSLLFLLALSASAAIPAIEKLLPDDTLFLLTTPDFTKMREVYRSSPQTQFWNDPAMKPFKDRFMSKLHDDLLDPLEQELGVKFADYTNLLQGQISFAVTQNDWPAKEDQHPGILFLLDAKDKSGQLTKDISDFRKKWVDAGKTIRTEKIRNSDFYAVPISPKDMPKTLRKFSGTQTESEADETTTNAPKSELFIGQYESLLIVGTSAKPIEKVLVHLTGGSMPALGDLATYEESRLELFRDAPLYGWANSKSLVDALTRKPAKSDSDTPDPMAAFDPSRILAAIGIGGMKAVAFSVQSTPDGSTIQVSASIPETARQGLLKVLPGEANKDSSPPPFVPADAVKFQRWRLDGQKTWAAIQKVLGDISPQAAGGIHFMLDAANDLAKQKDPDFDINKSFFGNLGDDIISYEKAPRGKTVAELNSPPSMFLIGSPNADQLASALKFLLALANQQGADPQQRDFLGRKIYSVPLPSSPLPGANPTASAPAQRTLSYVASGGYLAMSTDASLIEEYLRSADSQLKALRQMPGLTDAIARAGGSSTGCLGFENQAETTRATFEALRNESSTNSSNASMMPGLAGLPDTGTFKDWMDYSLLPPFDKVSKYFGISVYTASADMNGMTFKLFAPVPSALRK